MYYFDYAATSLIKPKEVADAVYQALLSEPLGNPSRAAHDASIKASKKVYQTRKALKELFHAGKNYQVVFTKNATESLNIVLAGGFNSGDHLLSTCLEHNSVLRPLDILGLKGITYSLIPLLPGKGTLDYERMNSLVKTNTKALIVSHASNVTGNLVDLKKIAQFCQENQLRLVVDAAQTAGFEEIDINELGIDALCFTGHKSMYGPQGIGGIVLKNDFPIRPLISGGTGNYTFNREMPNALPDSLEAGTLNSHGIAGLLAGVNYLRNNLTVKEQTMKLANLFYEEVVKISTIQCYGDFNQSRVGVISLNIENQDSNHIAEELFEHYQIAVRAGFHCAPEIHKHFKTEKQGMVRFSFSHFNTKAEINYAVNALKEIAKRSVESG
ncbi:aminotransferase class V-fold PLP-dependent enzyme [Enterococcus rivorum]|uniref:cysteine desulfurase n=1 Tax=Enterococcus rivorum TaxID=762845 RepID=A0A1E5KVX1_9ENTE|nr:aminotransferase class V-fold PLP-dependent enzyme [Enterococcus rivorum]MBP2100294.1 cysteine desulfurase family protein [Enterococcus rivorum]OEH82017.1 hypothetical protein BCR26_15000 [Enterococcus rivorum]